MYQSLALASSPGQAAYADAGAFLHPPGAGSPVFVPPARVPSMLPYLPACEPGPQPPALAGHPGWAQAASADSSAFGSGSPHPPTAQPPGAAAFPFAHNPPGPGGGGGAGLRDGGAYQGALLAREQYPAPLGRPVGASYPTAYPAYVSTEVAQSWTSGAFEGSVLHSLQGRPAGLSGRRATLGECGAAGSSTDLGPAPGSNPHPAKCSFPIGRWQSSAGQARAPGVIAALRQPQRPDMENLLHIRRRVSISTFPSSFQHSGPCQFRAC